MKILDLKVICCFGAFKQLMLYLLYYNILAVEHDEDIACSKVNSTCPAFDRRVEGMLGGAGDRLTVYPISARAPRMSGALHNPTAKI